MNLDCKPNQCPRPLTDHSDLYHTHDLPVEGGVGHPTLGGAFAAFLLLAAFGFIAWLAFGG